MPERVRIRFDDDGNTIDESRGPAESTQQLKGSSTSKHGKKRKREHGHNQDLKTQRNPHPAKREDQSQQPQSINYKKSKSTGSRHDRVRSGQPSQHTPKRLECARPNGNEKFQNKPSVRLRERSQALLLFRQSLPIWREAQQIRDSLSGSKDVLLVAGETGSGKSTQLPQFLLDEPWCTGCIAVTEPRRVAAVSLARRVAEEMGTPLGSSSPASKVGYSVRFDNSTSPCTRIKYLTEGMLLQEMLRDPSLKQYSAVVVDEVHERSVNVDLVLGFLRRLITGSKKGRDGKPLKVVVMSATADVQRLLSFFQEDQTMPSEVGHSNASEKDPSNEDGDSDSSWSGISSTDSDTQGAVINHQAKNQIYEEKNASSFPKSLSSNGNQESRPISLCHVVGRQFPVELMHLEESTSDYIETALKVIMQVHHKEPLPGDMLVFLPGQDTIESLETLLNEYAMKMERHVPHLQILPLFAALPQAAQQKVFLPPPPKTRKVILSTNIAETSVTVPGVRIVIDSGKAKIKQFRNRLGLESLLEQSISQDAATQRMGRAGREGPGQCYRLYTKAAFGALPPRARPEILRCDLSGAVLNLKARGVGDVAGFPFLDAPAREALEQALLQLLQLGALEDDGAISGVGRAIARLPLAPTLGRVLVEAARPERDCVGEAIDVIAALSVETVFLPLVAEERKEAAEEARRELFRREGDHLTLLAAVRAYAAEQTDRKAWAERYFVSHRAMQNVMDVRKQLRAMCGQMGLLASTTDLATSVVAEAKNEAILLSILRGFALNTARIVPDGSYRTLSGNQTVAIHPSSVLFGRKCEAIVFSEYVYTNRSYARGVSAVRLDWVSQILG